jgi:hypothetical protein
MVGLGEVEDDGVAAQAARVVHRRRWARSISSGQACSAALLLASDDP